MLGDFPTQVRSCYFYLFVFLPKAVCGLRFILVATKLFQKYFQRSRFKFHCSCSSIKSPRYFATSLCPKFPRVYIVMHKSSQFSIIKANIMFTLSALSDCEKKGLNCPAGAKCGTISSGSMGCICKKGYRTIFENDKLTCKGENYCCQVHCKNSNIYHIQTSLNYTL